MSNNTGKHWKDRLSKFLRGNLNQEKHLEVTARRELEEETGYGCHKLSYLQTFATSPGFADEVIHLFVAEQLFEIEEKAELDEDEFVELMQVSVEEAEEMVKDGRIYDAKTAFAVLWMKLNKS